MKNLLKFLVCFMLPIIICGNNKMCHLVNSSHFNYTYNCTGPALYPNSSDTSFLTITFYNETTKIYCHGSPDWKKFNYSFRNLSEQSLSFYLINCTFNNDTSLYKLARLTNARQSTEIAIKNNSELVTIINKNLFKKFGRLLKLEITNNNNLTYFKNDTLKYLSNLRIIKLENNSIETLPKNFFKHLTRLKFLSLSINNLQFLHSSVFKELVSLEYLSICFNKLTSLPKNIFENNVNIRYLNLKNNCFWTLPGNIFRNLNNLAYLTIAENNITELPANAFSGLRSLKQLQLNNNNIKILPYSIWSDLTQLKNLNLQNNRLERIPMYVEIFLKNAF